MLEKIKTADVIHIATHGLEDDLLVDGGFGAIALTPPTRYILWYPKGNLFFKKTQN